LFDVVMVPLHDQVGVIGLHAARPDDEPVLLDPLFGCPSRTTGTVPQ
jgi:hypothetical protein